VATRSESLRRNILALQDSISAVERCRKPVIAAVNGACVGGGIDLIAACDIRCCDQGAFFQV
jgi:enoyl-CoA hydratase/carnithine racemase